MTHLSDELKKNESVFKLRDFLLLELAKHENIKKDYQEKRTVAFVLWEIIGRQTKILLE